MSTFAERRAEFRKRLGGGVVVIPAAPHQTRSNDTQYEYRQSSDLHYLTAWPEPDAVLVMTTLPEPRTVLFVLPLDRTMEIWNGRRVGVDGAKERYGADEAYPIGELAPRLPDLLAGHERLWYTLGESEPMDRTVLDAVRAVRRQARKGVVAPIEFHDPRVVLAEMRLIKTPDEIEIMRRAAAITRDGFLAGMRNTRPGFGEYAVEARMEYEYLARGAQAVAYPSICGAGHNATILHYNTNREELRDGTLLLVDSACELDVYATDVTRTWPVNGKYTAEQRAIYEIVLRAQKAGIEAVAPGASFRAYHNAAVRVITEGLVDLGLLKGDVDALIEREKFTDFFMHNTGHWLGLDVHDVGAYKIAGEWRKLEPGMALTVEPGIYIHGDLDVPERWKGIGVRIEDDVLVTQTGRENLTESIPREIAEIEAMVGADVSARA
ncbi:MAG TPA: aminopeptidase P N-terminal domain-containing protein [Candidatus Dormibacteraeota bacterium]|nr:aminopeptidase P N-terminal domain-containing protein [Candidatus Dormibacteraeota bacterium]